MSVPSSTRFSELLRSSRGVIEDGRGQATARTLLGMCSKASQRAVRVDERAMFAEVAVVGPKRESAARGGGSGQAAQLTVCYGQSHSKRTSQTALALDGACCQRSSHARDAPDEPTAHTDQPLSTSDR